jgi:hypothetical protein
MKKFLIKGLILIVILSFPQLGASMSYFSDTVTIAGNTLTSSSLEVGMRSGQGNFVSNPLDLEPGDSVTRDIYTQKLGSLDSKYRSEYEYVTGDTELCDALQVKVWYNWYDALPSFSGDHSTRHMNLKYNGPLSSFNDFDTSEITHDPDMQLLNTKNYYDNIFYADNEHWFYYHLSLPSGAPSTLQGKTCTFNIRTTGWQTNFPDESSGFSDTAVLQSTVATGDWTAPYVKINAPPDNAFVDGVIDIYGTITDNDPHHYWLVVQDLGGATIAGPGVVNETTSLINELLYTWDTAGVSDGEYVIKLEARDGSGNKEPNLAPVPSDPEVLTDSVDWITVKIDRTAPATPLLISPGNNTSLNSSSLTQTWQQVTDNLGGEVYYDYESYNDAGLNSLRWTGTYSNSGNGNGLIITKHAGGAPNGHVYWRVRARDESGNTSFWPEAWHFLINNDLSDPNLDGSSSPISSVVLNEILPDPLGADDVAKPNGEWIELYNKSGSIVSIAGWHLTDADDNSVLITGAITNTGGTDISGHGFLVIYTGTSSLTLDDDGDTVNLYSGLVDPGNLIDFHIYGSTPEGKSIVRYPDGDDTWYDPIPTPGEPNTLETGGNLEKANDEIDLEEPEVSEPSAELKDENISDEEIGEPVDEITLEVQDPVDTSEAEKQDEDSEEAAIEEPQEENQEISEGEPSSEPEPEESEPQPEETEIQVESDIDE